VDLPLEGKPMRAARSTAPAYLVVGINWKSTSRGKDVTTNWGRSTGTSSGLG